MLNKINDYFKLAGNLIVIVSCIVSVTVAIYGTNFKLSILQGSFEKHCEAGEISVNSIAENRENIISIQKDIEFLRQGMSDLKEESKNHGSLLNKILMKVSR